MSVRIYLLSLREISSSEQTKNFVRQASLLVDEVRREKAEKIRKPAAQAVSLGAGLLLQKMVLDYQNGAADYVEQDCEEQGCVVQDCEEQNCEEQGCVVQNCEVLHYEARELLELLKTEQLSPQITTGLQQGLQNSPQKLQNAQRIPIELQYRFEPHGKPKIVDFPLHFSLSHSGDYVLCAVSDREVGADIQKLQSIDFPKLASRFFAKVEYKALEECDSEAEQQKLFFRLWTKKEAYGKLTGQGVTAILSRDVCHKLEVGADEKSSESFPREKQVSVHGKQQEELCPEWLEIYPPEGYAAAVCMEGPKF